MKAVQLALRPLALLLSLPPLGMAAYVVSHPGPFSPAPAIVGYILFCAAAAALISLLGIASAFLDAMGTLVQPALDLLALLFLFAGAVALAVQTGPRSCDPGLQSAVYDGSVHPALPDRLGASAWITDGYTGVGNEPDGSQGTVWHGAYTDYVSRCRMAQATDAFLWFTWAAVLGSAVFTVRQALGGRKARTSAV